MYVVESKIGPSEDCDASHPDQSGVESECGKIWSLYETPYFGESPFQNFEIYEHMEPSFSLSSFFLFFLFFFFFFLFFSFYFWERAPCLLLHEILGEWNMSGVSILKDHTCGWICGWWWWNIWQRWMLESSVDLSITRTVSECDGILIGTWSVTTS